MQLDGRLVLVAGASSGIGACTAVELGRAGARVALLGRRSGRLESVAERVRGAGGPDPLVLTADLTDAAEAQAAFETAGGKRGGLDALVYAAGVGQWQPLLETREAELRRILEVNLVAAALAVQRAVPLMRRRGGGLIVLVSSVAGLRGMPGGAVYSASKAALEGLSDALRVELRHERIRVSSVYPSLTRTDFFENLVGGQAPSLEGKWAESPEAVARKIVKAIRRERRRAVLSLKGRLIVALARLAPGLLDRLQARRWPPAPPDTGR
jgi:short-subunit dehydrogenase